MRVVVSRRARANIAAITRYIRDQGAPQAAKRLGRDLDAAIASIAEQPEGYEEAPAIYGADYRRAVVRGTWLIFFRVLPGHVQVVAVRDGRREPERID